MSQLRGKGKLFVISGSSGSGKGSVLGELLLQSDSFCYSVSATTRTPRPGEVDGVNYFFIGRDEFLSQVERGEMLEHAEYCGNFYGTPRSYVEEKLKTGMNVLLEIEVCGAMQIKEKIPDAVLVFIMPPSYASLRGRLYHRATETPEVIENRLKASVREVELAGGYDFIILNRDGMAAEATADIIAVSEGRYTSPVEADAVIRTFIEDSKK